MLVKTAVPHHNTPQASRLLRPLVSSCAIIFLDLTLFFRDRKPEIWPRVKLHHFLYIDNAFTSSTVNILRDGFGVESKYRTSFVKSYLGHCVGISLASRFGGWHQKTERKSHYNIDSSRIWKSSLQISIQRVVMEA
jgi:hypothetical protein